MEEHIIILYWQYSLPNGVPPVFAVQVSKWTQELLLFGKVELGKEKSNKELEEKFLEQIKKLTLTVKEKQKKRL